MAEVAELKARYLGYGSGECDSILICICTVLSLCSMSARGTPIRRKRGAIR